MLLAGAAGRFKAGTETVFVNAELESQSAVGKSSAGVSPQALIETKSVWVGSEDTANYELPDQGQEVAGSQLEVAAEKNLHGLQGRDSEESSGPIPKGGDNHAIEVMFTSITGEATHAAWSGAINSDNTIKGTTRKKLEVIVVVAWAKESVGKKVADRRVRTEVGVTSLPGFHYRNSEGRFRREQRSETLNSEFVKRTAITKRRIKCSFLTHSVLFFNAKYYYVF